MVQDELTPQLVAQIIERGPLEDLQTLPIALALGLPDRVDVQAICLQLAEHEDEYVRGNAVLALGHLARLTGELHETRVRKVLGEALEDDSEFVRGQADNARSDLHMFLGWDFDGYAQSQDDIAPVFPEARYQLYIIVDAESRVLIERDHQPGVLAPSDLFAPDPRGLSHGHNWRLPGFGMDAPLSENAKALNAAWDARKGTVFVNESNLFEEAVLVQARHDSPIGAHALGDWVWLKLRAYYCDGPSSGLWPAAPGIEQRWVEPATVMADLPVSAHDRYALAQLDEFWMRETGMAFL
ncbi:hypothetical protein ACFELO_08950 [Oceanicaulis sp. LC35]|uniref:hypothetical protein n=1 Tax=Oceanicaulis sp. LC35 TaxID=3349635 RepID=UPI003F85133C